MTEDELKEIEDRLRAASTHRGRPWIATCEDDWADNWLVCSLGASNEGEGKNWYVTTDGVHASELRGDAAADAVFIAHAPADVRALLKEVRRLQGEVEEYRYLLSGGE